MVYTGTITTEAEIAIMAGENVDNTGDTEANRNLLVAQVEAFLSCLTNYDLVTNYASLTANLKQILSEYASRYVGATLILYNTAGYESLIEAEDMVNFYAYRMQLIEQLLSRSEVLATLGVT